MKFNINGFEVEIKARRYGEKRCNKLSTMYFINWLSLLLFDSARLMQYSYERTQQEYTKRVSDMKYEQASELHQLLENNGFYDDIY